MRTDVESFQRRVGAQFTDTDNNNDRNLSAFSSSFLFLVHSPSIKGGVTLPRVLSIDIITCQLSSHGARDGSFHLKHQRAKLPSSDTFSALRGEGGREQVKSTSHVDAPVKYHTPCLGCRVRCELEMIWKFNCLQAMCWEND